MSETTAVPRRAGRPNLVENQDEANFKLGQLLRKTRLKRKLSQLEVAKRAGIHPTAVSVAERKGNMQFATAIRVFRALKADLILSVHLKDEDLEVTL